MTKLKHDPRQKKDIGEIGEWFVYTELTKMGIECSRKIFGGKGWDIVTIDGLIIEVKTANRKEEKNRKGKNRWQFSLRSNHNKLKPNIDFIVCVGLIDGVFDRAWVIPKEDFGVRSGITIQEINRNLYITEFVNDKYEDNWLPIIKRSRC